MRAAYFDCFSGVSGDMCLGALVDAGVPLAELSKSLEDLRLGGFSLRKRRVTRGALRATKVDVVIEDRRRPPRGLREIHRLLGASRLPAVVREQSRAVFERLAQAEGSAHRTPAAKVHFHELGGLDSIVDVVGTVMACHLLGIEGVFVSAINVGSGTVTGAHGVMPVPAPATANLLQGFRVHAAGPALELTTPTGAGLMATLAAGNAVVPHMTLSSVGYGAGSCNPPYWPNVLRVFVGETIAPAEADRILVLETNLDDMNPQGYELLMERLFAQGALDATLTPVIMKRGRPGIVLTVLADRAKLESVLRVIFAETTTLGVRIQEVARRVLAREITEVATRFGPVRVKAVKASDRRKSLLARPEYTDCKRIAEHTQLPLRAVFREVEREIGRAARRKKT